MKYTLAGVADRFWKTLRFEIFLLNLPNSQHGKTGMPLWVFEPCQNSIHLQRLCLLWGKCPPMPHPVKSIILRRRVWSFVQQHLHYLRAHQKIRNLHCLISYWIRIFFLARYAGELCTLKLQEHCSDITPFFFHHSPWSTAWITLHFHGLVISSPSLSSPPSH